MYFWNNEDETIEAIESQLEIFKSDLWDINFIRQSVGRTYDKHQYLENDIFNNSINLILDLYKKISDFMTLAHIEDVNSSSTIKLQDPFLDINKSFIFCRYIPKWLCELAEDNEYITQTMKNRIKRKYGALGKNTHFKKIIEYRNHVIHDAEWLVDIFYNGLPWDTILDISVYLNQLSKFIIWVCNITEHRIWGGRYFYSGIEMY